MSRILRVLKKKKRVEVFRSVKGKRIGEDINTTL